MWVGLSSNRDQLSHSFLWISHKSSENCGPKSAQTLLQPSANYCRQALMELMKLEVLRIWAVKSPRGYPPMRKVRDDAFRTEDSIKATGSDRIRAAAYRAA